MITLKRISLLLALGACLAAAGCGSDDEGGDPIPADQAAALDRELSSIEARLQQGSLGACEDIFQHPTDPNESAVESILSSLPRGVDPDVREALQQSFDNLWALAQQECDRKAAQEPDETEPTPEPEPTPTETQPETTPTTPTETDTEPTSPDEEVLPPDGDGENGGAVPEGNGNDEGASGGIGPGTAKEKKEAE